MVARHRTRPLLTPLALRRTIVEEAAAKPEAVRLRSLRRRLTPLDRALTDRAAEALDRLSCCIDNLSNVGCLNICAPRCGHRLRPRGFLSTKANASKSAR